MSEVLATIEEMQADFERTGTLAPMYARELFRRFEVMGQYYEVARYEALAARKRDDERLARLLSTDETATD